MRNAEPDEWSVMEKKNSSHRGKIAHFAARSSPRTYSQHLVFDVQLPVHCGSGWLQFYGARVVFGYFFADDVVCGRVVESNC